MVLGIYCYVDTKDNSIVYIGKDSHIENRIRNKAHYAPSQYEDQPINRILQNNPLRYDYNILEWNVTDQKELNTLEIDYIAKYNPKFNFTIGGDGIVGFKFSKKSRDKMSESQKGNKNSLGCIRSEETKQKISKANKGKIHSQKSKINMSQSRNSAGYYRVCKQQDKTCNQGFLWCYQYYNSNNKRQKIRAIDLKKLEQKVKDKGLPWYKLGDDNNGT